MISIKNKKNINLFRGIKDIFSMGFFHLLSANIIIQIAGFGGQIFLTRILSADDIGRIKILQSFLVIFSILGTVGINTAVLKLCSEDVDKERKHLIFNTGIKINIVASISIVIIAIILSKLGLISKDDQTNKMMYIYIWQLPFLVISSVAVAYLQALKKVEAMSSVQVISKMIIILLSTFTAYTSALEGYILGLVVSNILTFFLIYPLLKEEMKSFFKFKWNKEIVKVILDIGKFAVSSNLLGQLLITLNILIASYLIEDKKEIGYYSIAQLIITTLMMIPSTLNQIMTPHISEKSNDLDKVKDILVGYKKKMAVLMVLLFIGSYFIIPIFMPIIFGAQYKNSIIYFKVLLLGLVFWSMYSPKGITLMSVGEIKYNFYTNIQAFIISIIFNTILIIEYGMIGGAIATTLTYFVTIFINNYYFNKFVKSKS